MARPIRVEFPGAVYHVMARGNERRAIFRDDEDRRRFLTALQEMAGAFEVHLLVYCLMPNHYHLVVRTARANLSRAVGWLQTTYTIRFNRRHRRSGHLFQGRFKAQLVEEDGYAVSLMRYIHLNPIRTQALKKAALPEKKKRLDGYHWSSHRYHGGLARPVAWLKADWMRYYGVRRGEAQAAYRRDIHRALEQGEEMTAPWADLRGGLVLGGEALWEKAGKLMAGKSGQEEIRWSRAHDAEKQKAFWEKKLDEEPDRRWKIWLRVRALGERKVDVARSLGYRDGGSVLQVLKRLEGRAETDKAWRVKKRKYEDELSRIKS